MPRLEPFLAFALLMACNVQASTPPAPIESYVAPPAQFPAESNYAGKIPAPLAAYDGPRGKLVGHIRPEKPDCLRANLPASEAEQCTFPLGFVYKPMGQSKLSMVEQAEWGYETMGMPSYTPSVKDGTHAWSQVRHQNGSVWVKTQWVDVHPYENVAYLVNDVTQLCVGPGTRCRAVSTKDAEEMKRLANLITCYDSPYTIADRITHGGKRYYKLDITTSDEHKTTLPHPIYVPTRNPDGSHTGAFFARGC